MTAAGPPPLEPPSWHYHLLVGRDAAGQPLVCCDMAPDGRGRGTLRPGERTTLRTWITAPTAEASMTPIVVEVRVRRSWPRTGPLGRLRALWIAWHWQRWRRRRP